MQKKIIVALLILAIIFSLGSMFINLSLLDLDFQKIGVGKVIDIDDSENSNIKLIIETNDAGGKNGVG